MFTQLQPLHIPYIEAEIQFAIIDYLQEAIVYQIIEWTATEEYNVTF